MEYYEAVSKRLAKTKDDPLPQDASSCLLSNANIPSSTLAMNSSLSLYHVAVGRGTQVSPTQFLCCESNSHTKPSQNYTCASPSSTPVPIGAVATLFNATCIASSDQATLDYLTGLAYTTPLNSPSISHGPASAYTSGHHYFTNDAKTATFNLHNAKEDYGITFSNKISTAPAAEYYTASAPAVAWLQLKVLGMPLAGSLFIENQDQVGNVQNIYRVKTIGGSPPPTCDGQPSVVTVDYAAQYWFYHLP